MQQVDGSKGSKYTKRDVEPVLQKARRKMNDKGMLPTDLPSPAQALEQEAVAAMKDGDYGKAKFAADQLYATVDSMKIDKAFISAKIGRLNAAMKGKSLDGDCKKEADALFRGATSDYGDGRFPSANGKLNKIYALILASTRGPKALTPGQPAPGLTQAVAHEREVARAPTASGKSVPTPHREAALLEVERAVVEHQDLERPRQQVPWQGQAAHPRLLHARPVRGLLDGRGRRARPAAPREGARDQRGVVIAVGGAPADPLDVRGRPGRAIRGDEAREREPAHPRREVVGERGLDALVARGEVAQTEQAARQLERVVQPGRAAQRGPRVARRFCRQQPTSATESPARATLSTMASPSSPHACSPITQSPAASASPSRSTSMTANEVAPDDGSMRARSATATSRSSPTTGRAMRSASSRVR